MVFFAPKVIFEISQKAPDKSQRLFYLIKEKCKKRLDLLDMLMLMTFTEGVAKFEERLLFPG